MIKQLQAFLLNHNHRNKIINLSGCIFLLVILAVLVWAANKGFEFSDESFYSIGYLFGIDTDNTVIFFHRIYNLFFGLFNFKLSQIRILGIFLTLISSLYFSFQASLYFSIKDKISLLFTVSILGFLPYIIFPMVISYNSLSSFFVTIILATTLYYLRVKKKYLVFIVGALSTLLILNKFTNIVFLIFLGIGLLLIESKPLKLKKIIVLVNLYLLGLVITLFIFFPSIKDLRSSYENFIYGLSLSTGHGLYDMFIKNYNNLLKTLYYLIYLVPLLIVLYVIKVNIFKRREHSSQSIILIFVTIILSLGYLFFTNSYLISSDKVFSFHFFILTTALSLIIFYKKFNPNLKKLLIGSFFILIPFVSSLGTNNSLFIQFTFYGSSFGLGVFLFLNTIPKKVFYHILLLSIFSVSALQITYNKVLNPYRLKKLVSQTEKIKNISYLSDIKVDSETYKLIKELEPLRNHPAEKVFLCSDQLGVSIILNKKPLFFSWIDESSYHLISNYLENKKGELGKNILFFIPSEKEKNDTIISELSTSKKLNFTKNYQYYRTITINSNTLDIYQKRN